MDHVSRLRKFVILVLVMLLLTAGTALVSPARAQTSYELYLSFIANAAKGDCVGCDPRCVGCEPRATPTPRMWQPWEEPVE